MTTPSCANCKHYVVNTRPYWNSKEGRTWCDGPTGGYADARASDDQGLESWFSPPPDFCCKHHFPKEETK